MSRKITFLTEGAKRSGTPLRMILPPLRKKSLPSSETAVEKRKHSERKCLYHGQIFEKWKGWLNFLKKWQNFEKRKAEKLDFNALNCYNLKERREQWGSC